MSRILLVGTVALMLSTSVVADCSSTFIRASHYPSGPYAAGLALGDFTNDGKTDAVVTTQANSGSIQVLPGNGDGTFGEPISTDANVYPGGIVAGYFDGDANLDVAIPNGYQILVFLGNGDGTFQPPTSLGGSFFASDLVVADLNGDGKLDLAQATNDGHVVVFLGDGNGGFSAGTPYATPDGAIAQAIAAGQFNANGSVDLAVTLSDNTVGVFPGNGDGTFAPAASLPVGPNLSRIVVADLSSDGILDIAVSSDTTIGILRGNGDGTFQAAVVFPIPTVPVEMIAGDFDGDGRNDLAILRNESIGVAVLYLQQEDGTFAPGPSYQTEGGSLSLAATDLDGDGRRDLVASGYDGISVLLNLGGASYLATAAPSLPAAAIWVTAGDFLAGGSDELVSVGADFTLTIFGWSPDTGFEILQQMSVTGNPVASTAGDFDGDGKLDLAVATNYGGVFLFRGNGDGTLQPPTNFPAPVQTYAIVSADFSGDGKPDLAVLDTGVSPAEVSLYVNDGSGTFSGPTSFPLTHFAIQFTAADLDGDGHPDLVVPNGVCCTPTNTVSVLLGDGNGGFLPATEYPTGPGPVSVAVGDFDGDGHADLIVANSSSNISLLLGDGQGAFGAPTLIATGWIPAFVTAADVDGDGALDVLTSNPASPNVTLLRGNGHGQFQTPVAYMTGPQPFAMAIGRFDGGNGLDVAVANTGSNFLTILQSAKLSASVGDRSVIVGSAAVLEASASGYGAIAYQWRRNGVPLSDGGPISGAMTATLTISPVAFTDAGSYDVVVTDSCTNLTSNAATLAVEFDDVPLTNPFHNDILTIAAAGITSGCTLTSFCPSNPVSRAEMAVFLLKAKDGADHVPPPPPPDPIFPDVPADAFAAAWIDSASLGVTGGCGGGLYCPDRSVSRAEMAVFLLKTLLGSGYTPPPPAGLFADVPADNFAIAWIEDLYNRGITAGCATNPLRFCPDANVPREQMATFLVRTFLP